MARSTLSACIVLVASIACLPLARAGEAINILPYGDSITAQGQYINALVNQMDAAGYNTTQLANEGYSGYIIDGSITGAPRTGLAENTAGGGLEGKTAGSDFLNTAGANAANTFILLMIGTNDVDTGFDLTPGTTDPTHGNIVVDVAARYGNLINDIRTEDPLSHIVVAEITPNLGAGKDPAVQAFNSVVANLVTGLNDPHVSLVDMYSAFESYPGFTTNPSLLMADNLHPNATGGIVMANVWANGIQAALVPEPSSWVLACLALAGAGVMAWRRKIGRRQACGAIGRRQACGAIG